MFPAIEFQLNIRCIALLYCPSYEQQATSCGMSNSAKLTLIKVPNLEVNDTTPAVIKAGNIKYNNNNFE